MAGGGRRFEFGWLDVLGLILAFAGGSAIVFFLGVFVGKGLQEGRVRSEERVVRLPIDGVAESATRSSAKAQRALPPEPTATMLAGLAIKPAPTATRSPRPTETRVPVRPVPTASPVRRPAATAAPDLPPATASPIVASPEGRWAVQVNATKSAKTAKRLITQLRLRGYKAYLVEVRLRGETWYRVRVGRFGTMEEATAMVVRLKNKERYPRAFLVEE